MGDLADMMLDGTLCEGCGVYLGDAVGYPRRCKPCRKDQRTDAVRTATHIHHRATKTECPTCGRRVKIVGLADHMRDSHG
jgi:Zn finger protein HypA/HybF involved in hydrogenase expression